MHNHGLARLTVTYDGGMGDEELAAPGDLEHVRQFVNTRDLELGTDTLHTWFDGAEDLARAKALREAFRALLLANATGEPPPDDARAVIENAGRLATLRADGDLRLAPAGPDERLARLLAIAVIAQADGTWRRLKACPGERLPVGALRPHPQPHPHVVRGRQVRRPHPLSRVPAPPRGLS